MGGVILNSYRTGTVKIGYRWWDLFLESFLPSVINIEGSVSFKGKAIMGGGIRLNIADSGILTIGNNVQIGSGTCLDVQKETEIGDVTCVAGNCYINSTDGEINIGSRCWLNYGTEVRSHTVIPNYSISARNSLLVGDYSNEGNNLFLVGAPAKTVKRNVQRIFSRRLELQLHRYFFEHPNSSEVQMNHGLEDDDCKVFGD